MKSWMETLAQSISQNVNHMASLRTAHAQSQERLRDCRYCADHGHFLQECPKKDRDLLNGRIKWDNQRKYLLFGDGTPIPMGDGPIILRVDKHYSLKAVHLYEPVMEEDGMPDLNGIRAPFQYSQFVNSKRDSRDDTIERQRELLRNQGEEIQEAKRLLEMYKMVLNQNTSEVATPARSPPDPVKQLGNQMAALQEQFAQLLGQKDKGKSPSQSGF